MRLQIIFLCFFLIGFSGLSYGQKKVSKSRSAHLSKTELLDQATVLRQSKPAEAIRLLEEVINRKEKRTDFASMGQAYYLLGQIYEDIDQKELAIQRYDQALAAIGRTKDQSLLPMLHQRMGQLFLATQNGDRAKNSFTLCIQTSQDNSLTIRCQEGLADLEAQRGNADASLQQLDYVERNYELDSLARSRVEAKRAQNYIEKDQYDKASESFYNSVNNLPAQVTNTADYEPVQKAEDALVEYQNQAPAEQLEIRQQTADLKQNKSRPDDQLIAENIKITEILEKENRLVEAESYVSGAKNAITEKTKSKDVAEVFKKSYELNRKLGKLDEAILDLDAYTKAKEAAILELEIDLQQQIEIVKNQQRIDLNQKDLAIDQKDEALLESQLITQQILIGLLSLLLAAGAIFFYFLYKNVKEKRKANQLLLLKSLRTQMNPHFIFNALNSVNNFIAKNDEKAANKFLSDFSKLMRKVLDYSQRDFINLEEEIELNELYLKLEHFRFRDKFEYTFEKKLDHQSLDLEIPPMLIQPFIENAVWHGLRYKEGAGLLQVHLEDQNDFLLITIRDNGIGRKNSLAVKTKNQKKYKSTGLANVSRRVSLINELYDKAYQIEVSDADPEASDPGTLVMIKIPIIKTSIQ